jgi:hypothetical protein
MGKINFLIGIIFFLSSLQLRGQQIAMYKTFGGVRFVQGDTLLTDRQVSMILIKNNSAAYEEFKSARKYNTFSSIMGFSGATLIGIPVVTAIAGGDPEWVLAASGGAILVGSILFHRTYKAKALNALDIYNEKFTSRINTSFYFSGTAVGVRLKF